MKGVWKFGRETQNGIGMGDGEGTYGFQRNEKRRLRKDLFHFLESEYSLNKTPSIARKSKEIYPDHLARSAPPQSSVLPSKADVKSCSLFSSFSAQLSNPPSLPTFSWEAGLSLS